MLSSVEDELQLYSQKYIVQLASGRRLTCSCTKTGTVCHGLQNIFTACELILFQNFNCVHICWTKLSYSYGILQHSDEVPEH
jgi:hypothetical protein